MGATKPRIHLVNPFSNPAGGTEWRTLSLFKELQPLADVRLWSNGGAAEPIQSHHPIRSLSLKRLSFPRSGTLVMMGVYFDYGKWLSFSRPSRVIIVYNTPDPDLLHRRIARIRQACRIEPEIVYCSESLKQDAGLPGIVEPSLIDLADFSRSERPRGAPFTIGRLSRADPLKHHPDDMRLYARLAEFGIRTRVMGATEEMQRDAAGMADLDMLPANSEGASAFLNSLDVFFYRTDPRWYEPWGRVITEAMACGLPVVGSGGGYAAIIENGVNGYVFKSEEEAVSILLALQHDHELRSAIGQEARETVAEVMGRRAREAVTAFYLR